MKKLTVIYISPGPAYNTNSPIFQQKYKKLSTFSEGYIFSTAPNSSEQKIESFHLFTISRRGLFVPIKFLFFCIHKALDIMKQGHQIDLVVTYDPLTAGLIGIIMKLILKAKLIVEVNGVYTSKFVWGDYYPSSFERLKKLLVPFVMNIVFFASNGILFLYASQQKYFNMTTRKKIIASFPCWVPTSFFKFYEDNKEVLFIGFPMRIKGVDILIRAFKNLAPKFPDWKLKILGWYPNISELEKEIDQHPQIFHHKPVPYEEIPRHIGSCGIFVLPSRTEAMGRVLVEAAAAGKARIGSNVDGIPNVINNKIDGLLFKSECIEDLEIKLTFLMSNDAARNFFATAAKSRSIIDFSEETFISNTKTFYTKIFKT